MLNSDWSMSGLLLQNNRPLRWTTDRCLIKAPRAASLHSMRNMDFMPFPTWQPRNKHTMSITTKRWSQKCLCENLKREIEDVARKTNHFGTSLYCPSATLARERATVTAQSDSVKRWNIFFITISTKSPESIHIFVNSPCNKRDNILHRGHCLLS